MKSNSEPSKCSDPRCKIWEHNKIIIDPCYTNFLDIDQLITRQEETSMPTMSVQEFWSCQDKCYVAVHCNNNKEAQRVMRMFNSIGKAWGGKDIYHPEKYTRITKYDPSDTRWSSSRGGTCYTNMGGHGSLSLYQEWQKDPCSCHLETYKRGVPWVIIESRELINPRTELFTFDLERGDCK